MHIFFNCVGKLTCPAVGTGSPSSTCPWEDYPARAVAEEGKERQSFPKVMRGNEMQRVCNKKMDWP